MSKDNKPAAEENGEGESNAQKVKGMADCIEAMYYKIIEKMDEEEVERSIRH